MKSRFTFLFAAVAALLSVGSPLRADNIVVYKGVYTEKGTVFSEQEPDTANAVGGAPSTASYSLTYYLALNLTTKELVRVNYYRNGAVKEFSIDDYDAQAAVPDSNPYTPAPLIETYDITQPVKGKVPSFLWSGVSASAFKDSNDGEDDDAVDDLFFGTDHGLMSGVGVPFALGNGTFIQNVAPKISGTWLTTYSEYVTGTVTNGNETFGPNQYLQIGNATETVTLDAVLTKAANLTPIPATVDLGLGAGPHPAGSLNNAIQRIRDALVKQGYALPLP